MIERLARKPAAFRGVNFVTPTPLAYFKLIHKGRPVVVELSQGSMAEHRLYGVMVRLLDGAELWDAGEVDPSRVFARKGEALEFIRQLETT